MLLLSMVAGIPPRFLSSLLPGFQLCADPSFQAMDKFSAENAPEPVLYLRVSFPVSRTSHPSSSLRVDVAPGRLSRPTTARLASSTKCPVGEYSILTSEGERASNRTFSWVTMTLRRHCHPAEQPDRSHHTKPQRKMSKASPIDHQTSTCFPLKK